MTDSNGYIGIKIEESVKKQFQKLCEERGSNMSVELKRYIYKELKEANK